MQEITLPRKPIIIKQEGNSATFEIRSCYPGYGMTLGIALRRVLLSSLVGCAVTSVKIAGVSHEFATISGVVEDVVEIILNLKKVRFKMHSDGPVSLSLVTNKEGEIMASDIKATSDVEIVNKDALIATITDKNSKIEMEIQVEKGIGYMTVEQQNEEKTEIGRIAMDAIFAPIRKVNYRVESMRVGKMTNYDRLIIEIETDGSITPEEAFKESARLLVKHFDLFGEVKKEEKEKTEKASEKEYKAKALEEERAEILEKNIEEEQKKEDVLKILVTDLSLSPRILRVLEENKIKTVGKLVKKSEEDLRNFSGMGDKGIKEIKKSLGKSGLILKNK